MNATPEVRKQWEVAQRGERMFHCDEVPGMPSLHTRRKREAEMRRWYAGMMRIPYGVTAYSDGSAHPSVTDLGCGPDSLLLAAPIDGAHSCAVDPLQFTAEDETEYRLAGIRRVMVRAEEYIGPNTDEVWLYNCLQHVVDPEQVVKVAIAHATRAVRVFEWCNVPTDGLHLHTLTEATIRSPLLALGWRERYITRGEAIHVPYWRQDFYSAVWEPKA